MVINLFLLRVKCKPGLTEKIERLAVIVSFTEEHSDLEVITFLKLTWSFVFQVRRELPAYRYYVAILAFHAGNDIVSDITLLSRRNLSFESMKILVSR